MLRRQDDVRNYRVERVPLADEPIVLGVVLEGTFFSRFGDRVEYNGTKYQLECPSTPNEPLRLVGRSDGSVVEMSPHVAEEHLREGRLRQLD